MSRRPARFVAAALLLVLAVLGACADVAPTAPPAPPPPPTPAAQASAPAAFDLGAVIQQVRLAFRPAEGAGRWSGGTATYTATISAARIEVTPRVPGAAPVAFETTAIGRGEPAKVGCRDGASVAEDGHLTLDRGVAVEHLRNTAAGLHQSFRFAAQPAGHGDLEVRLHVTGAAYAGATGAGHHFRDASGASIRYGRATWVDAAGRETAMEVRYEDGGDLTLVVPEAVLASSAYPAEIDPLISPQIDVDQPVLADAGVGQTVPAVAFDGTNYLVVWHDDRGIDGTYSEIYGARVSAAGALLDPGGLLVFHQGSGGNPPVVAFDGTNYLVVILDNNGVIRANRVTTAGLVLDGGSGQTLASTSGYVDEVSVAFGAGVYLVTWGTYTGSPSTVVGAVYSPSLATVASQFTISAVSGGQQHPRLAFGGGDFFVAWEDSRKFGGDIYGARVSTAGVVLDPAGIPVTTAQQGQTTPTVAYDGTNYLVAWKTAPATGYTPIQAARVSAAGVLLDTTPIAISSGAVYDALPRAAFDGVSFTLAYTRTSGTYAVVYENRVSSAGTALDGTGIPVAPGTWSEDHPAVACSSASCLVVWEDARGNSVDAYGARLHAGAVLDPSGIHVSNAASEQEKPAMAFGNGEYLVVWEDAVTDPYWNIWGARLSPTGTVLDPSGIAISTAPKDHHNPRVAASAGGFLVAWEDLRHSGPGYTYTNVYASRVSPAGAVLDSGGIALNTSEYYTDTPVVAADGADYAVAWHNSGCPFTGTCVEVARVSAAGALLDATPVTVTTTGSAADPSIAFGGGEYLIVWAGTAGVSGARFTPAGALLDAAPGFVIGGGDFPSAGFNGTSFVAAYRQYTGSAYQAVATRVTTAGAILDASGIVLSTTTFSGYTSAPWRQGPEVTFDGTDSLVVWPANLDTIYAAWLTPAGVVLSQESTLVASSTSVVDTPAIAGQGDGDHTLLTYVFGDPTPGVEAYRIEANVVTARSLGHACAVSQECKSGYCIDGVCCNTLCTSACEACTVAAGAPTDGTCAPLTGTACNDGNACDHGDTCQAGVCTATTKTTCTPLDACHAAGACQPATGTCTNPAATNGTSCNDGNACTTVDTCQAGVCTGGSPVICAAPAACQQAGGCNPTSGQCVYAAQPDGTGCNDGDACTTVDVCQAGVCAGTNPVVCTAPDACHQPGSCDPGTGQCSTSQKPDGSACPGGTCMGGVCVAAGVDGGGTGGGGTGGGGTGGGGTDAGSSDGGGADAGAGGAGTSAASTSAASSGAASTSAASSGAASTSAASSGAGGGGVDGGSGAGGDVAMSSSSGTPGPGAKGGCGCRTAGGDAPASGALLLPMLGWVLARRRPRSRRMVPRQG